MRPDAKTEAIAGLSFKRSRNVNPEEQSADQNPQTNDHIQGFPSAGVRYDHGFQEAPIAFWRGGKDQPTSWRKIHCLGFAPFGHQFGAKAWKENCSSVACDRLVAGSLLDCNF